MKALYLLAAMAFGCGRQAYPAERIAISSEFTPEEQAEIISAADEWCQKAGACVSEIVIGEGGEEWVRVSPMSDCSERMGEAELTGGEIRVCRGSLMPFRSVALHELGHALFPYVDGHSPDESSIMFFCDRAGAPESLTESDLAWSQESGD